VSVAARFTRRSLPQHHLATTKFTCVISECDPTRILACARKRIEFLFSESPIFKGRDPRRVARILLACVLMIIVVDWFRRILASCSVDRHVSCNFFGYD